jgi:hypothetical protein
VNFTSEPEERRSGRTTRMLLAAAIAVSEGKDVLIVGWNARHSAHLADWLCSILRQLRIPFGPAQVRYKSAEDEQPASAMEVFVDHYAGPRQADQ